MNHTTVIPAAFIAFIIPVLVFASPEKSMEIRVTPPNTLESVPQGAQRVPVLTVRISADCDSSVVVSSLSLRHGGLGLPDDILRVYAMQGLKRISRGHAFRDNASLTLAVQPVVIPACGETDISIQADFSASASAGGEHSIELLNVGLSDGSVAAPKSVPENAASVVTPSGRQTNITAAFRPVAGGISFGNDRIVARLLIENGINAAQQLHSIVFTNKGSASNVDLQNVYLETSSGERVSAKVKNMDGKTVTVMLDPPFYLERGRQYLLRLRADVRGSRRKTLRWTIEEPSDIFATQARVRR